MRVPPPKDLNRSLERRRSSEDTQKPVARRSITLTNRSSVITPALRKAVPANPTKTETRQSTNKPDEAEAMKSKIANLEDEIRRLKRRIEELEKEVAELQKQIRTKDKRIVELTKENEELKKRVTTHRTSFADGFASVLFVGTQSPETNRRVSGWKCSFDKRN